MVAGTERLTAGKSSGDSGPDDVSLQQVSGQGSCESDWVKVPCAFCHGTGADPFGIMSGLSTCCVCKGKGTTWVRGPQERCVQCRGTDLSRGRPVPFAAEKVSCLRGQPMRWCAGSAKVREMSFQHPRLRV